MCGRSSCEEGHVVVVGVEHRRGLCSHCMNGATSLAFFAEDASGVGFGRMLRLSSVRDAENQHYRSISECSHLACDARSEHSHPASEVHTQHPHSAGNAETKYSHSYSEASESHASEATPYATSFLRSPFAKLLPRIPCFLTDFHDDDDNSPLPTQFGPTPYSVRALQTPWGLTW